MTPVFFENYPPPEKQKKKKKIGLKKRTKSTQEIDHVNLLMSILHDQGNGKKDKKKKITSKIADLKPKKKRANS